MKRTKTFLIVILVALWLPAGCRHAPPPEKPEPPVVKVATPIEKDVADYEEFTGRTEPVSRVDIRARVSGYLVEVNFKDGDIVPEGKLLYQIDPRPFQADLDMAQGELERLEAQKKLLDIQVDRYQKLATKGAASQQDVDEYIAQQAENIGAIKTAQARIEQAELNLGFTRIAAPITGDISRTLLTIGNLINADKTLLTTLMSIDPMYAYFNIEEPTLLRVQKMMREGIIKQRVGKVEVRMGLADDVDRKFPLAGTLDFVNNTVDPQTGTILVRGTFDNPYTIHDRNPMLTPGLFVRVRLNIGPTRKTLLIDQRAVGTDQGQKYVYVVDKDNKIVYHRVKLGQIFDNLQAIRDGLQPDERVVVDGLQRIRPGIVVKPEPVQ